MACVTPIFIDNKDGGKIPVACGKCAACLKRKRNDWVTRLTAESRKHSGIATFVTLTYDDDHLPLNDLGWPVLDKSDLQKYFKRLRKNRTNDLIYYAIGEYGPSTGRPHYHYFDFGSPLEDAYYDAINHWHRGNVKVGSICNGNIGYVANFHVVTKRGYNDQTEQPPEFAVCSKGLGAPSEAQLEDISRYGYVRRNGLKLSIPKYWSDKLDDQQKERLSACHKAFYDEKHLEFELMDEEARRIAVERWQAEQRRFRYKTSKARKHW